MNPVKPMNQKRCPLNHCEWIHSSDGRCLWPGDWCPRRQERLLALWNQALHWTAEKKDRRSTQALPEPVAPAHRQKAYGGENRTGFAAMDFNPPQSLLLSGKPL